MSYRPALALAVLSTKASRVLMLFAALIAPAALVGCGGTSTVSEGYILTPAGTTFTDNGATISDNAGSVNTGVKVVVGASSMLQSDNNYIVAAKQGLTPVSAEYIMSFDASSSMPAGTSPFNAPINITLPFVPPSGATSASACIFEYETPTTGPVWVPLTSNSVSTGGSTDTVSATTATLPESGTYIFAVLMPWSTSPAPSSGV